MTSEKHHTAVLLIHSHGTRETSSSSLEELSSVFLLLGARARKITGGAGTPITRTHPELPGSPFLLFYAVQREQRAARKHAARGFSQEVRASIRDGRPTIAQFPGDFQLRLARPLFQPRIYASTIYLVQVIQAFACWY